MDTPEDSSTDLPCQPAAPVVQNERIRSLDVLRGFALFGVLTMNMQAFADVFSTYMNPSAAGEISNLNFTVWCFNHVIADAKFITIFSMLFGAGIILMSERAEARTGRSAGIHYRRMGWMILFGIAHAILLWTGDILFHYGTLGLIAYLFRRFRPRTKLVIASFLMLIPMLLALTFQMMPAEDLQEMEQEFWAPSAERVEALRNDMRSNWLHQCAVRYEEWVEMVAFLFFFGWRILACMLIGMALFEKAVFSAERSQRFYVTMIVLGFGLGFPLSAFGIYQNVLHDWSLLHGMGVGSNWNYFGSLLAAFGWIGTVMLIGKKGSLTALRNRLAAVGQMAFTNYIMQSVICTFIFNGHGFELFGRVDRIWQQLLVLPIFGFQLWLSPVWLKHFRFGPLEWLWRTLTYWKLPDFRRVPD